MNVLTCSKGKHDTIRVVNWYRKYDFTDYTVVVCADDDIGAYKRTISGRIVSCPSSCTNLAQKKEWMIKEFAQKNSWVLSIDDNVKSFHELKTGKEISPQELIVITKQNTQKCDKIGTIYGGYASNTNAFFNRKEFATVGFVWGKVSYMKNAGFEFMKDVTEMDDYAYTALCLYYFGKVLIDRRYGATAARYERVGGNGTAEMRKEKKKEAVKKIMERYPGLFNIKEKKGLETGTEILLRFNSEKALNEWRHKQFQA